MNRKKLGIALKRACDQMNIFLSSNQFKIYVDELATKDIPNAISDKVVDEIIADYLKAKKALH
jgi:hypothetical protein